MGGTDNQQLTTGYRLLFTSFWGFLPAPAQRFVEGDQVGGDRPVALDQFVLAGQKRTLGLQHVQEFGLALGVETGRQVDGFPVGVIILSIALAVTTPSRNASHSGVFCSTSTRIILLA